MRSYEDSRTFDMHRSYADALTTCRSFSTESCPSRLLEPSRIATIPQSYDWPNELCEYDLTYRVDGVFLNDSADGR